MKCVNCGLPLSPANTSKSCPRCHTSAGIPIAGSYGRTSPGRRGSSGHLPGQPAQNAPARMAVWGNSGREPGVQSQSAFPEQRVNLAPDRTSDLHSAQGQAEPRSISQKRQMPSPPPAQASFPQQGQGWLPTATPPSMPIPVQPQPPPMNNWTAPRTSIREPSRLSKTNLGFIVAGACVITGAFLLICVYFMAATLLPAVGSLTSADAGTHSVTKTVVSTSAAISPTPVQSPTVGAFVGQQYIDNPQMASIVNTNTAKATQLTTTFRVGQKVYVTFNLHPNGHTGVVCLLWYLNARNFSHFEFSVTPNSTVAYAYTFYGGSGSGYVEMYWASTTACTDKLLAQRVNFTVTQ